MPNAAGRFDGPWSPGSDAFNANPGVLLRADNLTREEVGIAALRQGSRTLSTGADGPIVSLLSVRLSEVDRLMSVTKDNVYVDGVLVADSTLEGEGDIAVGSNRGHFLVINGSTKYKYDGDTLRNWGIVAPTDAPDVTVVDVSSLTVANFTQTSAEFTASEGTRSYQNGVDGTANAATGLVPAVGTGRGIMSYVFSAAQNLLNIQGNRGGDFDILSIWVDDPQPEKFTYMDIDIGISSGSDPFLTDYYHYRIGSILEPVQVQLTTPELAQAAAVVVSAAPKPESTPPPPEEEVPPRTPPETGPGKPRGPIEI